MDKYLLELARFDQECVVLSKISEGPPNSALILEEYLAQVRVGCKHLRRSGVIYLTRTLSYNVDNGQLREDDYGYPLLTTEQAIAKYGFDTLAQALVDQSDEIIRHVRSNSAKA